MWSCTLTLSAHVQYKDSMHGKMVMEFSKKFDDAADIVRLDVLCVCMYVYGCACLCVCVYITEV